MANFKEFLSDSLQAIPLYMWIVLAASLLIAITGFFVPPVGYISGTAITMCGVLFGGTSIFYSLTHLKEWIEAFKETKKPAAKK